MIHWQKVIL